MSRTNPTYGPDPDGDRDVVSLFSGAGGLDAGLEQAGWRTVSATDHDRDAVATLETTRDLGIPVRGREHRYLDRARVVRADVRELSGSDLRPDGAPHRWRPRILSGGPPCQPWSSAGHQKGLRDPRGQLFPEMVRIVDEMRPRFVIFENVRGLLTAMGPGGRPGEVLESVQAAFDEIGYASRVTTLNAADFGAAQRRVRLMLIATAEYALPTFPAPSHSKIGRPGLKPWVTLSEALSFLPYPLEEDIVRPSGERAELLAELEPGKGLRTGGRVESNRPGGHWGYRQDAFLADLGLPARTIRAAATPDWIREEDGRMRRLTWRECAHIQGFPADWGFQGTIASRFRQIGNAVQVDVGQALGERLSAASNSGPASVPPVTPPWDRSLVRRTRYTTMEHAVNGKHRVRVRVDEPEPSDQLPLGL